MRKKLLARRGSRVRPGFDDKVLADWNGLMIAALAKAAEAFDKPQWLAAAEAAFDFVSTKMITNGRLLHAYRAGEAKAPATANDYANMIRAALALANVTGKRAYVERAREWTDILDKHYWADDIGGYYFVADDTSDLIVRPMSGQDEATPNANGTMVSNLMALYLWTGDERYRERAEAVLRGLRRRDAAERAGACRPVRRRARRDCACSHRVVVPEGGDARALRRALNDVSLPGAVVQEVRAGEGASACPTSSPAHGKTAIDGKPTAYVCIGPQCSLPVTEPAKLVETIKAARQVARA